VQQARELGKGLLLVASPGEDLRPQGAPHWPVDTVLRLGHQLNELARRGERLRPVAKEGLRQAGDAPEGGIRRLIRAIRTRARSVRRAFAKY